MHLLFLSDKGAGASRRGISNNFSERRSNICFHRFHLQGRKKKSSTGSSRGISTLGKFRKTVRVSLRLIEKFREIWITDVCASKVVREVT